MYVMLRTVASDTGPEILVDRPRFVIGRSGECDLQVSCRFSSRHHCELRVENEHVTVHDLGSRNGTSVNGGRISDHWLLCDGDVINVGSLLFEVRITDQAPCLSGQSNDSNKAMPLVVG